MVYTLKKGLKIQIEQVSAFGNLDVATFISWAFEFEQHCQTHQLICKAQLAQLVISALLKQQFTAPENIYLVSFDDLSPVTIDLLDALKNNGSKIAKQELHVTAETQQQIALQDSNP